MAKRSNLTNFLKGSLLIGSLLLFLSINPAERSQGFVTQESLELNMDDNSSYFVQKTEKNSLEEMKEISLNKENEEAWLYFPAEKSFYEIGYKSQTNYEGHNPIVRIDSSKFLDALNNADSKKGVLVHTHPGSSSVYSPAYYSPSLGDISVLENFGKIYKDHKPNGKLIGGIVSAHGITSFEKGSVKSPTETSYTNQGIWDSMGKKHSYELSDKKLDIEYRCFDEIDYSKNLFLLGNFSKIFTAQEDGGKFYEILK